MQGITEQVDTAFIPFIIGTTFLRKHWMGWYIDQLVEV